MISSTASKLGELAGLSGAKRALLRLSQPDSSVHAVLLYGAEGAGKETLAEALAQAWLCTNPSRLGACGECPACEAFGRDKASDLLRVGPLGPSDLIRIFAITDADNPPEEYKNVLPLIEFLRTPPLRSRNKVVRILRADRMNQSAANALLKTLEEPHPYGKLVLTTAEIGRVLPTIVSRCVSVACQLPDKQEMAGAPADLIRLAEGAPGRLQHVTQHAGVYRRISDLAARLPRAKPSTALALAEQFRAICDDLEDAVKCGARAANVEGVRALGAALSGSGRDDWMTEIAEAHRRLQGNGNSTMVLDAMFARMLV